jgi:hypothetical protein
MMKAYMKENGAEDYPMGKDCFKPKGENLNMGFSKTIFLFSS